MAECGNALSRSLHVCASCSSLADGMEGNNIPALPESVSTESAPPSDSPTLVPARPEALVADWDLQKVPEIKALKATR
jgi:hypothetical protein